MLSLILTLPNRSILSIPQRIQSSERGETCIEVVIEEAAWRALTLGQSDPTAYPPRCLQLGPPGPAVLPLGRRNASGLLSWHPGLPPAQGLLSCPHPPIPPVPYSPEFSLRCSDALF